MLELMINDEVVRVDDVRPDTMLLNYLREQRRLTGTKEGCASGDCGACTVVMVDIDESRELRYRQINACITPLNALHGKQIITVEHLKQGNKLHPVQQLVVDKHGTQCGFCTPGFVMSLYALSKQKDKPDDPTVFLSGNLCRCTGYGPLIEAAEEIAGADYQGSEEDRECERKVKEWMSGCERQKTPGYIKPITRAELADARRLFPEARLISGGTDLALEVTQQLKELDTLIDLSAVDDLISISETTTGWRVGAAVPLTQVHDFMQAWFPSTDEIFKRLGSMTIRNRATIGGSLGHASPIGDIAPLLISLSGQIEVDDGVRKTLYAPEEYITGYCETALKPEQWVSAVHIPRLMPNQKHAIYKVSKRVEDDISTLVLAVNFWTENDGSIKDCIVSAGGVAAKSIRLSELESLFTGRQLTQTLINQVKAQVPNVITPLSDVRASAEYRIKLMQNLFQRFYLEYHNINTRLADYA